MPRGVQADPLDSPRWGVTEHDRAHWIDGLRVKMAFSTDVHMDVRALFIDGMAWMIATMNEPPTIEDDVGGKVPDPLQVGLDQVVRNCAASLVG